MDMKKLKTNNDIFQMLGELVEGVNGINIHLGALNGSVAKLQDKGNAQDVLNAQMTLTQQQLVTDIKDMKGDRSTMNKFWYGVLSSLGLMIITYFLTKS